MQANYCGGVGGVVAGVWIRYWHRPWPTHLRFVSTMTSVRWSGPSVVASVLSNCSPSCSRQGWRILLTCSAFCGSLSIQGLRELDGFRLVRVARKNVEVVGRNYLAVYLISLAGTVAVGERVCSALALKEDEFGASTVADLPRPSRHHYGMKHMSLFRLYLFVLNMHAE